MWEGKGKKAVQVCDCERAVTFVSPGRKKCSAKNAKAKGDGGERELVKAAEGWGWTAHRTAGSGAHGSRTNEQAFATDVRLKLGDLVIRVECKRHASIAGVKTLNKLRDNSDVLWLQRDFGVFLVNVFDTGQAARVLAYPSFGLAYLLARFAGVIANKALQLADWRERPLPGAGREGLTRRERPHAPR
jgi:protein required for attachment to host cells